MQPYKIAGIGELLWDVLPDGETLGGAPVNFAYHVSSLGAHAYAVSTVGRDNRAERALQLLADHGVETAGISSTAEYPTGYVTVDIDADGIATYDFPDAVAWDHLIINDYAENLRPRLAAVCFGTLAQRRLPARHAIQNYLAQLPPATLKVCDLNLRQHFYSRETISTSLDLCTVLKLNEEELQFLAELFELAAATESRLADLINRHRLELIILTRGGGGSLLWSREARSEHPGVPVTVVDTIGAGDSFTAAAVIGLLEGRELDLINEHANRVAAHVCSHPGAMVPVPASLRYE